MNELAVCIKEFNLKNWNEKPLSELCSFLNRGSSPIYVETGGMVVLNQKCVRDQRISFEETRRTDISKKPVSNERVLNLFDVLINSTGVGTLGRVAQVTRLYEPTTVDAHVTIARANPKKIWPKYLGFALRSLQSDIEALAEGSTGQTELNRSRLGMLRIPFPSRHEEQVTISEALGSLDDKIELNRKMNETLEEIARSLFKSWFVDFEPVRAKMEGRDTGLPKEIANLFPSGFQDSEMGEIPKGWQISSIRELTSNIQYGLTQSASSEPIGPKFLRITDIQGGNVNWVSVPYCHALLEEERYRLMPNDILVARTGASTGENIYLSEVPRAVFASYLVRFQFKDPAIARLVGAFMRTSEYFEYVASCIGGSAQPNASAQVLAGARLVTPSAEIALSFFKALSSLDKVMVANNDESQLLITLRDSLLPKLISGELKVKNEQKLIVKKKR